MEIQLREVCYYILLLLGRVGKVGIISSYYTSHFRNKNTHRKMSYI